MKALKWLQNYSNIPNAMGGHNSKITIPYNTSSSKNVYDIKVNPKVIETVSLRIMTAHRLVGWYSSRRAYDLHILTTF